MLKKKYDHVYNISSRPVAGIPLYPDGAKNDQTLEELLVEQGKRELREAQKEEAVAKMEARTAKWRGTAQDGKPAQNPKRYLVDPETGLISVDEEEGELTSKDAMLVSASIKGKRGQYDDAIGLIKIVKGLGEDSKGEPVERLKEFYVDPETGIIVHDPDNGEYTLSEARTVSQSLQKSKISDHGDPPPGYYVDEGGKLTKLNPGEPVVVTRVLPSDKPTSFLDQITGLSTALASLEEVGPLIRSLLGIPEAGGNTGGNSSGSPVSIAGPDGKPIITNLGEVINWRKFLSSEERETERHNALMGLAKTVREVLPDGVAALQAAAKEIQGAPGAKTKPPQQKPGGYRCGDCETQFGAPAEWAGQPLKCPGCQRVYTKEELEA